MAARSQAFHRARSRHRSDSAEKFLATGAIAATPVGFSTSNLQPEFGLTQGDDAKVDPVFSDRRCRDGAEKGRRARRAVAEHPLGRRLRAPAQRRHLLGLPSDPRHRRLSFSGRRLAGGHILPMRPSCRPRRISSATRSGAAISSIALRDGRTPDYSRGFSSRPQLRGSSELAGTEYDDGWGAHCYASHAERRRQRPQFPLVDLRRGTGLPGRRTRPRAWGCVLSKTARKWLTSRANARLTVGLLICFIPQKRSPDGRAGKETWTTSSSSAAASAA